MNRVSTFLLVLALSLNLNLVKAELVSIDWLDAGDGLITYDTNAGLYWLDVSYSPLVSDEGGSTEHTYDSIKICTEDPSDILFGFRHATIYEVEELFINAGLLITNDGFYHTGSEATPIATSNLIELIGVTYESSNTDGSIRRQYFRGYTSTLCGDFSDPGCPANTDNELVISAVGIDYLNRTYAELAYDHAPSDHYFFNTGHFLISKNNPAIVPIPAPLWLFLSGLAVLVLNRLHPKRV
jgi:hypothetical protein